MKTEFREVVVKQPVYIADDGREFDDEDECADYEFSLLEASLTYYDKKLEVTDDVEGCYFINLSTAADVKRFKKICDTCDLITDGIDKPGIYMYIDCRDDCWINMEEVVIKIKGETK